MSGELTGWPAFHHLSQACRNPMNAALLPARGKSTKNEFKN
jgi:hypothetical protein